MPIFPVQYSTLSAKALKKDIESCYRLQKVKCKFHVHGVSDTYIVEHNKGKNIFRIYRSNHRTLEEIKAELEMLLLLKKRGRAVAQPVTDSSGSYLQEFEAPEGIRYGVMFAYAEGKSPLEMSSAQYTAVGKEVGAMHNEMGAVKLKYPRRKYDLDTLVHGPLKKIKPAFREFPEGHKYLKKTAEKAVEKIQSLNPAKFSYGYCHFDLMPKNLHFTPEGQLTIFDFDFLGEGWMVCDLASFHAHFLWHQPPDGEETCWKNFMEGYRSVRQLPAEEEAAIPYLGFSWMLFYLGFQQEAYDDWSNFFFHEPFLRRRVSEIRTYTEKYCKL
jgi:Ser/Thr protein kinase RdoA (MazF antagonist)